jgi:hypothetical protein
LRAVAEYGSDIFYRGSLAQEIARAVQAVGGLLSTRDLEAHRSDWVIPISTEYRGVTVFELPPNSQGVIALMMLDMLKTFPTEHLATLDDRYVHLLAEAARLEGHPDNAAAALLGGFVVCADGAAARFEPPPGLEAVLVVPHRAVRTAKARAALPAEVPMGDAVFNVAHASLLVLGLARGDWDLVARGLADRLHEPRRAHLYPQSLEVARRARELGALGATISGAGPSVLVWCQFETTGAVAKRLRELVGSWAGVLRVPFELEGATVRGL